MDKKPVTQYANIQKNSPNSCTASKKKYETFWRMIFLVVTIASGVLINKVYQYQTNPHFDQYRRGDFFNLAIYGLLIAVVHTIFDLLVHYVFDQLCQKYFITLQNYTDPQVKKKRSYTLVKWGYSIIYYALSSIAGYIVLKDTIYFPKWLGGKGDPLFLYNNYPDLSEAPFSMQIFYIVQFGKHFSRAFTHLFIRAEGNYYQYALHHLLSVFLIFFSYTMDMWLIGCFVFMVHDYTDFTLITARLYKDYRHKSEFVLQCIYVVALTSWIGVRIIIFTYCCIYCQFTALFNVLSPKIDQIYRQTCFNPLIFMGLMLCALQVLHIFWTYYIVQSAISVNLSKNLAKHTYD